MSGLAPRRAALTLLLLWAGFVSWQPIPTLQAAEAPAHAAADDTSSDASAGGQKSYLMWVAESSGWIGAVILVLSIYFVSTVVRMFMELRPDVLTPPELFTECKRLVAERNFSGLYQRVKEDESFFATVLTAGLVELPNGFSEAREVMDRLGDVQTIALERKISMLAVLGTLGPMIGLLGTLKGMIASFSVIAMSDTQLKPSEVAGGISEALLLTFEGVFLSVPAIYFFSVFRNRVSSFSAHALLAADEILRDVQHAVRRPAAAAVKVPGRPGSHPGEST